jgi:cytoskeletal protein CcmA (bactofilin family)
MTTGTPSPPEAPPARRFTDTVRGHVTVLGPSLKITGELTGAEALEVVGRFHGPLSVEGLCHLHPTARVEGPVSAGDAVIEGELKGSLTVRGTVELRATARVWGDINATSVAMAEGCYFEGHIHMKTAAGAGPTSFQEKRRRERA